eukprot:CAMPEP_0170527390 /NCGR_PEP_ID=MMETSP0209-20121228/12863_1 /TAXON_ID=665100 ORGANISM="Litonotus pictus, Strain P1" /NCGR_SAMPLE_ID=MMETSP0209 /ASSEMBLY_ACC=CAM_ASM_000301 /LENGTH=780 /DNA_ID=CAMNT_0010817879 /DNA_START=9 /DNA_END=2351 /DNA_ORIENTATION=+
MNKSEYDNSQGEDLTNFNESNNEEAAKVNLNKEKGQQPDQELENKKENKVASKPKKDSPEKTKKEKLKTKEGEKNNSQPVSNKENKEIEKNLETKELLSQLKPQKSTIEKKEDTLEVLERRLNQLDDEEAKRNKDFEDELKGFNFKETFNGKNQKRTNIKGGKDTSDFHYIINNNSNSHKAGGGKTKKPRPDNTFLSDENQILNQKRPKSNLSSRLGSKFSKNPKIKVILNEISSEDKDISLTNINIKNINDFLTKNRPNLHKMNFNFHKTNKQIPKNMSNILDYSNSSNNIKMGRRPFSQSSGRVNSFDYKSRPLNIIHSHNSCYYEARDNHRTFMKSNNVNKTNIKKTVSNLVREGRNDPSLYSPSVYRSDLDKAIRKVKSVSPSRKVDLLQIEVSLRKMENTGNNSPNMRAMENNPPQSNESIQVTNNFVYNKFNSELINLRNNFSCNIKKTKQDYTKIVNNIPDSLHGPNLFFMTTAKVDIKNQLDFLSTMNSSRHNNIDYNFPERRSNLDKQMSKTFTERLVNSPYYFKGEKLFYPNNMESESKSEQFLLNTKEKPEKLPTKEDYDLTSMDYLKYRFMNKEEKVLESEYNSKLIGVMKLKPKIDETVKGKKIIVNDLDEMKTIESKKPYQEEVREKLFNKQSRLLWWNNRELNLFDPNPLPKKENKRDKNGSTLEDKHIQFMKSKGAYNNYMEKNSDFLNRKPRNEFTDRINFLTGKDFKSFNERTLQSGPSKTVRFDNSRTNWDFYLKNTEYIDNIGVISGLSTNVKQSKLTKI